MRFSLVAQLVKSLPAVWETWVLSLGWEDPLEKEMAPKTRPDSPVPSLQGPCDRSLKSEVPCGSCLNWR